MQNTSKRFWTMKVREMVIFKTRLSNRYKMKMRDKLSEFRRWCSKCSNSIERCKSSKEGQEQLKLRQYNRELRKELNSRDKNKMKGFNNNNSFNKTTSQGNFHRSTLFSKSKIGLTHTSSKFQEFHKCQSFNLQETKVVPQRVWVQYKQAASKFEVQVVFTLNLLLLPLSNSNSNSNSSNSLNRQ